MQLLVFTKQLTEITIGLKPTGWGLGGGGGERERERGSYDHVCTLLRHKLRKQFRIYMWEILRRTIHTCACQLARNFIYIYTTYKYISIHTYVCECVCGCFYKYICIR